MNATIELITTRERLAALVVPWRLLSERYSGECLPKPRMDISMVEFNRQ